MGTDWLEHEIESIRTTERMRQQKNQLQLHRASVLQAKADIFFADAGEETKKAVDILNREFKDDQKLRFSALPSWLIASRPADSKSWNDLLAAGAHPWPRLFAGQLRRGDALRRSLTL